VGVALARSTMYLYRVKSDRIHGSLLLCRQAKINVLHALIVDLCNSIFIDVYPLDAQDLVELLDALEAVEVIVGKEGYPVVGRLANNVLHAEQLYFVALSEPFLGELLAIRRACLCHLGTCPHRLHGLSGELNDFPIPDKGPLEDNVVRNVDLKEPEARDAVGDPVLLAEKIEDGEGQHYIFAGLYSGLVEHIDEHLVVGFPQCLVSLTFSIELDDGLKEISPHFLDLWIGALVAEVAVDVVVAACFEVVTDESLASASLSGNPDEGLL